MLSLQCAQVPAPPPPASATLQPGKNAEVERLRSLAKSGHAEFLEMCLKRCHESYKDYRCTFTKQERIGGIVGTEQQAEVKFRASPFSVAMAWTRNPDLGDRVLYVEGRYGGQMLVRPTGAVAQVLAGKTVLRRPDAPDVMKRTLHPVTEFGFEKSIEGLLAVYRLAKQRGDLTEELEADADVLGRRCFVLVRTLAEKPDYPAARTLTYIDQEYLVPIMVDGYGWKEGEFLCRYLYQCVQFNVGLTDEDFRPENNDLQTPK